MAGIRDLLTKYENKVGKVNWFKLQNDGDNKLVRFLDTNVDSLEAYEVHKVEIDGYQKAVKCHGENCVGCRSGNPSQLKIWIAMQNLDADGKPVEVWERGKTDIQQLIGLIDENGNLNERDHKIVRKGRAGDKKTTYQYFFKDKAIRTDLPAKPQILGKIVLELNEIDFTKALNGTYSFNNDAPSGNSQSNNGTTNAF